MNDQPIHYAVLRHLDQWDLGAKRAGLEPQPDGVLMLAQIPGTPDGKPIVVNKALTIETSGLAVEDCREIYIADTDHHRVIAIDNLCESRTRLGDVGSAPNQFNHLQGLLVVNDRLYVADSGNGRVQVFHLPSLALQAIWEGMFEEPTALAADSQSRIYLLDRGLMSVFRFSAWGTPDEDYNTAMEARLAGTIPYSLAIDENDVLYISDQRSNTVLRFDPTSTPLDAIPGENPARPRAMTSRGSWLYVADESTGFIWVFNCEAGIFLGTLPDYHGPVSALAVDTSGTLYIKPDLGETFYTLDANMAYVPSGMLTAGPLDAGVDVEWERVHVDIELPADTDATLRIFTAANKDAVPDWDDPESQALSMDLLITTLKKISESSTAGRRFLWLQVHLHSDIHSRTSPHIRQVQVETVAESYMEYLPAVYSRKDSQEHFLEHWLAAFRSQLGDLELELEEMSVRYDPRRAPEDHLSWLASWLALDPLPEVPANELRNLLPGMYEFYARRGTPNGIRDFVELYTGIRPAIFEAFRERHVWQLGKTSMLGFDTTLADGLPDGMIVPGYTFADPNFQGLRGEYYSGLSLNEFRFTQTDLSIDFDWGTGAPQGLVSDDPFSVRWTGQILPRYSERYTFHTLSDDGVRLWVDGILIIDQWIDQKPTEHSGTIELEAGRWYTIQLDYYENQYYATIKLYWSSRRQQKEIVPSSQLYSLRDDFAKFPLQEDEPAMLVGQTVVGESGPLNKADFGMPFFSEAAHLFTVSVPAGAFPEQAQRDMLQRIIEAEKPAHTDYHLCFVEPRMRVGFQARLGIDSIIAGPPQPLDLGGVSLGLNSYLGEDEQSVGRIGQNAHLGQDTRIG